MIQDGVVQFLIVVADQVVDRNVLGFFLVGVFVRLTKITRPRAGALLVEKVHIKLIEVDLRWSESRVLVEEIVDLVGPVRSSII